MCMSPFPFDHNKLHPCFFSYPCFQKIELSQQSTRADRYGVLPGRLMSAYIQLFNHSWCIPPYAVDRAHPRRILRRFLESGYFFWGSGCDRWSTNCSYAVKHGDTISNWLWSVCTHRVLDVLVNYSRNEFSFSFVTIGVCGSGLCRRIDRPPSFAGKKFQ